MSVSYHPNLRRMVGVLRGANLNTTADQAINIDASKYYIVGIYMANASGTPTLAVGGVYTSTSKGGTSIVSALQLYAMLTSTAKINALALQSIVGTDVRTEATLYFSLTTANGSPLTADIFVEGIDLAT